MIVVADTSPLNYLILIDAADLLPVLFDEVLIPTTVVQELNHQRAPDKVRCWMGAPPNWLQVRSVGVTIAHPLLAALQTGESQAIQLALERGIETVLIDDAEGRSAAEKLHLEVRGTLSVLERAARLGKVNLRDALKRLKQTTFRLSPALETALLERNP